ncbi:phosphotransferase enzyme family protein [Actinomadura kijaniata]|uniref:phosphotransferase enzyme family protein n=1 Tax=Actinomadura kijaniata TaxID=46161 RepID=UPI003F1A050A
MSRYRISDEVPAYHLQFGIMRALGEAGIGSVHPPVPAGSGAPYVVDGDDYWYLRAFTPHDGSEIWHGEGVGEVIADAARTLANLHQAGAACDVPPVGPAEARHPLNWSVTSVMANFDAVQAGFDLGQVNASEREELSERVRRLREEADRALAAAEDVKLVGLTHGDYRPANVLVRDGRVVNVLDWERARHDHHLHDAAFAALQFMVGCPCSCGRRLGPGATRDFLRRYLTERGVDPLETVPWMLRFVVLRRLLLNGRTAERLQLLRQLDRAELTDPRQW